MNVGLISDVLYKWDGGVDFLVNIAIVLENMLYKKKEINLFLFIPNDRIVVKVIKKILLGKEAMDEVRKDLMIKILLETDITINVVKYYKMPRQPFIGDSGKSLEKILIKYHIDVALPIMIECFPKLKIPWVAYIPDLQERQLPELFSEKELVKRDKINKNILYNSKFLLTTSNFVKEEIDNYYPNHKCKIYSTPFAPVVANKYINKFDGNMKKYNLSRHYFVISNQFWAHKSHDTAFEALEILYKRGYNDIKLYCTGQNKDYRGNGYNIKLVNMLDRLECKKNIYILGYIPKLEQVELIKSSTALIQPSLLEGDCGGCAVYLAHSLCVPCIMSDIKVNLEGKDKEDMYYFKVKNPKELANIMEEIIKKGINIQSRARLEERKKSNILELGEFYVNMLEEVIMTY